MPRYMKKVRRRWGNDILLELNDLIVIGFDRNQFSLVMGEAERRET